MKWSARGSIKVCPCKSLYKNVEIVIWLTNAAAVPDMTILLTKMILKSAKLEVLSQTFLSKIFFMAAFAESFSAIHNQIRANPKADRRYPTKMRFWGFANSSKKSCRKSGISSSILCFQKNWQVKQKRRQAVWPASAFVCFSHSRRSPIHLI